MTSIKCIRCDFKAGSVSEITQVVLNAGFNVLEALEMMNSNLDYTLSSSQAEARTLNSKGVSCPQCGAKSIWAAS